MLMYVAEVVSGCGYFLVAVWAKFSVRCTQLCNLLTFTCACKTTSSPK